MGKDNRYIDYNEEEGSETFEKFKHHKKDKKRREKDNKPRRDNKKSYFK